MKSFFSGLTLPFLGFRLWLTQPKLWIFTLIPWIISFALYSWAVSWLFVRVDQVLHWTMSIVSSTPTGWGSVFEWLVSALLKMAALILAGWSFTLVTQWLCFPFYDFLAKKVESMVGLEMPAQEPSFFRLAFLDLRKSAIGLVLSLLSLSLGLVPALNMVALALTWIIFCIQFASYAQSRRGYGVKRSLKQLLFNWPLTLGFGLSSSVILSLPWIGPLFTPFLVIAGVLYFSKARI